MTDRERYEAYRLEWKDPGLKEIGSGADGLRYFIDGGKRSVAIMGIKGITGLTIPQARAVCGELPKILEELEVEGERIQQPGTAVGKA